MEHINEYLESLKKEVENSSQEVHPHVERLERLGGDEEEMNQMFEMLHHPEVSPEEKYSILQMLDTVSIFSPLLHAKMPEYVNALRGLMEDESPELRHKVFEILSVMKDEVAQERLMGVIRNGDDSLVPFHSAIAMLGLDEKALEQGLVRDIIMNPPNEESLIQALRHFDGDEESLEPLINILLDNNISMEARALVPEIIKDINPQALLETVDIVLNENGPNADIIPFIAREVNELKGGEHHDFAEETKGKILDVIDDVADEAKGFLNDIFSSDDDEE